MPIRLAVIGAGNMGGSILEAVLGFAEPPNVAAPACAEPLLEPGQVVVCDRDSGRVRTWAERGVRTADSPGQAAAGLTPGAGHLLLAVKPQSFGEVSSDVRARGGLPPGCGVISIMAGVTTATIARQLGAGSGVVRAMPNLPARVRRGVTAIAPGPAATADQVEFAEALFSCVGSLVRIDEPLVDAFTALAGSGPAYVFYLCEAMAAAGRKAGFDPGTAERLARATVVGAAALLSSADESAQDLRLAVTSKGGTTEAAVRVLDERGVRDAVDHAVRAGCDRARALAAGTDDE